VQDAQHVRGDPFVHPLPFRFAPPRPAPEPGPSDTTSSRPCPSPTPRAYGASAAHPRSAVACARGGQARRRTTDRRCGPPRPGPSARPTCRRANRPDRAISPSQRGPVVRSCGGRAPAGPRTPRPHVGRRGAPADHRSARHRRSDRASAAASRTPTTSRRPACGGSSNRRRATASAAAVVDEPEPDDGGQCAALPGPAPPVATVDDRNAILTPDDCRIELVEVARRQPGRHHPLADRLEVRIAGRVADVGQRHEYPVRAPPLRVRPTPDRACPSSNRRTLGEDRLARWSLRIARESRSSSRGWRGPTCESTARR